MLPVFPTLNRAEAEAAYRADPQDPLNGIMLYFAQTAAHSDDEAMTTLKEVAQLPDHPAYIQYLLVQKLAAAGQEQEAWQALVPLLNSP
jgi:lipoprotein NlpI